MIGISFTINTFAALAADFLIGEQLSSVAVVHNITHTYVSYAFQVTEVRKWLLTLALGDHVIPNGGRGGSINQMFDTAIIVKHKVH